MGRGTVTNGLRVAIVHDQLYTIGGAEKVLRSLCDIFPDADVYALYSVLSQEDLRFIMGDRRPKLSFIRRLPWVERLRQVYFPLMPLAVEQFDLRGYDLIVSSSYLVAKGVISGPNQCHVCYIHSPMRYAWDQQGAYLGSMHNAAKRAAARLVLHYMRGWDARTANGVDVFVANSAFVARRTEKAYRRSARVLYPPVDLEPFWSTRPERRHENRFVTMSRIADGKRIDILLDAFRAMPNLELDIIGSGDALARLRSMAPPNVHFLGWLPSDEAATKIAEAAGFVFAAEEDFGISPVEAQAAGTPVVAFSSGGTAETVVDLQSGNRRPTGVLFHRHTPEDVVKAVRTLIRNKAAFDPNACRQNAERFTEERFRKCFLDEVGAALRNRSSFDGVNVLQSVYPVVA